MGSLNAFVVAVDLAERQRDAARQTLQTGAETITIASDTRCAVVWNAWTNDANIPDLGAGNHVGYLCVERGDVADHARTLEPGENYRAWMTLAC